MRLDLILTQILGGKIYPPYRLDDRGPMREVGGHREQARKAEPCGAGGFPHSRQPGISVRIPWLCSWGAQVAPVFILASLLILIFSLLHFPSLFVCVYVYLLTMYCRHVCTLLQILLEEDALYTLGGTQDVVVNHFIRSPMGDIFAY